MFEASGFHAKDGLSFERRADRSVVITKQHNSVIESAVTLDPATWESVVAFVGPTPPEPPEPVEPPQPPLSTDGATEAGIAEPEVENGEQRADQN